MPKRLRDRYVAWVRADDAFDLEVGKLYVVLPPEPRDGLDDIRVVDESGEDYLYPSSWFVEVDVPEESPVHCERHGSLAPKPAGNWSDDARYP